MFRVITWDANDYLTKDIHFSMTNATFRDEDTGDTITIYVGDISQIMDNQLFESIGKENEPIEGDYFDDGSVQLGD